ncbi:MAG: hypothetical protein ABRQ38_07780 [Candidatus Eremiobacterota bacterium]
MKQNKEKNNMRPINPLFAATIIILFITIIMFADVLFTGKEIVLSSYGTDLTNYFLGCRRFGFDNLREGNIPLWCPHIYSGAPYMGGFQSALLYPLNLCYLFLPLCKAINYSVAIHIFLAGFFMYLWTSYRKLNFTASIISSLLFMFCGAHFTHLYAGHISDLCTMTWGPLLFLSIDGFLDTPSCKWFLTGLCAITMQILAGHPQYMVYTFVAVVIYLAFSAARTEKFLIKVSGIIAMYGAGTALSAFQLLTGIFSSSETLRSGSVTYKFASQHSFPPENFITLIAPGFFGLTDFPYWGRSYFWGTGIFIGITGLIFVIYGAIYADKNIKKCSLYMIIILLILALGAHTPLFKLLYSFVPGFNKFRGLEKFTYPASLFITLMAGTGLDHLIKVRQVSRKMILTMFITGILVFIAGLVTGLSSAGPEPSGWWMNFMKFINSTDISRPRSDFYISNEFMLKAALVACKSLIMSSVMIIFISFLFFLIKYNNKMVYIIASVAVIEVIVFAFSVRASFDISSTHFYEMEKFVSSHPGDYRVLEIINPNLGMFTGMKDIWGHEPSCIKRYAEFMAFTQGRDVNDVAEYFVFNKIHPLFSMVRCKYIFSPENNQIKVMELPDPMAKLELIREYEVIKERDKIFTAMGEPVFNPGQKVILETEPDIKPVKSQNKGYAKILQEGTDFLTIEAETSEPAILLITDSYSKYWHAKPLDGSSQKTYKVMPANYILRAIPLSGGHHLIRVEYMPPLYETGKWISTGTLIICIGLMVWYFAGLYRNVQ